MPPLLRLFDNFSCVKIQSEPLPETIKLITMDGTVKVYDKPITVSRFLADYPKHIVCRSDSLCLGKTIQALSDDDWLELGQKYIVLPNHFYQTVLSFVTMVSIVKSIQVPKQPSAVANSGRAHVKKAIDSQPFVVRKSPNGTVNFSISDEFLTQLFEEEESRKTEKEQQYDRNGICTSSQLQKDYMQLVKSRNWKPELEPIRETKPKTRIFHLHK